jgi:cobalt-zinc-cadmium efflux system protein
MAMKHSHSHRGREHGDRDHGHRVRTSHQALAWALVVTGGMALVEGIGAFWSGSLALLSDAGHMATDAAALGLALFASRIARRPPTGRASYGYVRAEVLAAFVNALALLALVVFITVEAVRRLLQPAPVAGAAVLAIAIAGLLANLASAWILSRASQSMNTRGALLHVLSDVLGSVAAIVAGAVIVATNWTPIDPILSIVVSLLILRATWRLLAQSTGVLMEGVPRHLDYDAIGRALSRVDGIVEVHDLHIWQMGPDSVALSAHLALADGAQWPSILARTQRVLLEQYGIEHVTLQPAWAPPAPFGDRRVIPISSNEERR